MSRGVMLKHNVLDHQWRSNWMKQCICTFICDCSCCCYCEQPLGWLITHSWECDVWCKLINNQGYMFLLFDFRLSALAKSCLKLFQIQGDSFDLFCKKLIFMSFVGMYM
jgi:hypothetical protein